MVANDGESPTSTPGSHPSTSELKGYGRAGLDRVAAGEWHRAGIDHYAAEWHRSEGRSLEDAVRVQTAEQPPNAERRASLSTFDELTGDVLVSLSDIADLAERDLPTVSRWSKEEGFPRPVVGGRSPRFAADEAIEFVTRRRVDGDEFRPIHRWAWSRAVLVMSSDNDSFELAAVLIALAVQRSRSAGAQRLHTVYEHSTASKLVRTLKSSLSALRDVDGYGDLVGETGSIAQRLAVVPAALVRRLDAGLDAGLDPAPLLDDALESLSGVNRSGQANITSHELTDLIVELGASASAGHHDGPMVISDPCVGIGELLLWASRRHGVTADIALCANELDPAVARVTRIRFWLRSLPIELRVGDALKQTGHAGTADVILSDLPTTAGKRDLFRWIRTVNETLRPGGRAVIATTSAILPDWGSTFRGSALELGFGRLEALVLLPAAVKTGSRFDPLIAVLGTNRTASAVVIDLRDAGSQRPKSRRDWFDSGRIAKLIDQFRAGTLDEAAGVRIIGVNDLPLVMLPVAFTTSTGEHVPTDRAKQLAANLLNELAEHPQRRAIERALTDGGLLD
ncbi:MAG: hypothetical protein R2689_09695 [Microthrixaceae bacterium]